MLRRSFLKALGALAAAVGVPWAGMAHHRPGHDRGPGWRDREPDPPEEPDEDEPEPPEEPPPDDPPPDEPAEGDVFVAEYGSD